MDLGDDGGQIGRLRLIAELRRKSASSSIHVASLNRPRHKARELQPFV